MRAFADICEDAGDANDRRVGKGFLLAGVVVLGAAAFGGYSVVVGHVPHIPGIDANSVQYVLRLAGLRP